MFGSWTWLWLFPGQSNGSFTGNVINNAGVSLIWCSAETCHNRCSEEYRKYTMLTVRHVNTWPHAWFCIDLHFALDLLQQATAALPVKVAGFNYVNSLSFSTPWWHLPEQVQQGRPLVSQEEMAWLLKREVIGGGFIVSVGLKVRFSCYSYNKIQRNQIWETMLQKEKNK